MGQEDPQSQFAGKALFRDALGDSMDIAKSESDFRRMELLDRLYAVFGFEEKRSH